MTLKPVVACGLALGLLLDMAGAQTLAPAGLEPMRIGPVLGEPEKESIGYPVPPAACAEQLVFTPVAQPVGAPADDPEKESVGFLLAGERGCGG